MSFTKESLHKKNKEVPDPHNDVLHCLYGGKFLVSLRQSRVGPAFIAP